MPQRNPSIILQRNGSILFRSERSKQLYYILSRADWANNSDYTLSKRYKIAPGVINKWRHWLRAPKFNVKKSRHALYSQVDWTKQNCVIARELNSNPSTVALWRRKLKKPASPHVWQRTVPLAIQKYSDLDWQNTRDIDLARQVGLTRERMRQLRITLNKPECIFRHCSKPMIQFRKVFADYIKEKKEIPWPQFEALFPNTSRDRFKRWCHAAGIHVQRSENTGSKPKYHWQFLDFRIPNNILSRIWKIHSQSIAQKRYEFDLGEPAWHALSEPPPQAKEWIEQQTLLAANPPEKPMGMTRAVKRLRGNDGVKLTDAPGHQSERAQVGENLQNQLTVDGGVALPDVPEQKG